VGGIGRIGGLILHSKGFFTAESERSERAVIAFVVF
jgi:hypothetical protein